MIHVHNWYIMANTYIILIYLFKYRLFLFLHVVWNEFLLVYIENAKTVCVLIKYNISIFVVFVNVVPIRWTQWPAPLYCSVLHLLLFPVTSLFFFGLRVGAEISNITRNDQSYIIILLIQVRVNIQATNRAWERNTAVRKNTFCRQIKSILKKINNIIWMCQL